jgi:hypothetical protein
MDIRSSWLNPSPITFAISCTHSSQMAAPEEETVRNLTSSCGLPQKVQGGRLLTAPTCWGYLCRHGMPRLLSWSYAVSVTGRYSGQCEPAPSNKHGRT